MIIPTEIAKSITPEWNDIEYWKFNSMQTYSSYDRILSRAKVKNFPSPRTDDFTGRLGEDRIERLNLKKRRSSYLDWRLSVPTLIDWCTFGEFKVRSGCCERFKYPRNASVNASTPGCTENKRLLVTDSISISVSWKRSVSRRYMCR